MSGADADRIIADCEAELAGMRAELERVQESAREDLEIIADQSARLAASEALVRELAGLLREAGQYMAEWTYRAEDGRYYVRQAKAALAKVPKEGRHG